MKYNLTNNLILLRTFMKLLYIYTCKVILYFIHMGLNLICQEMRVARARTIWFAERGFIGSQHPGNFLLDSVFFGIKKTVWQHTIKSLSKYLINTTPQVNQELLCWHNYEEEEGGKTGQYKYWGGEFYHSEGGINQWEDKGGEN